MSFVKRSKVDILEMDEKSIDDEKFKVALAEATKNLEKNDTPSNKIEFTRDIAKN